MSYLDVIPRQTAKDYLRLDDTASDSEVDRMIGSALSFVETYTNYIMYSRNFTYNLGNDNCIRVYDFPITAVVKGLDKTGVDVTLVLDEDYTQTIQNGYTLYESIDADAIQLVLTAGYADPTDVPSELVDAALEMIDYWFYKNDGKANITLIPESVMQVLRSRKRYIL